MKRFILLFIGCGCLLSGCKDVPDDPGPTIVYKEYLIDAYIVPEELVLLGSHGPELWMTMSGPEYTYWSVGAEYAEFLRLAALHGGRIDRKIEVDRELYSSYGSGGFACYTEDFAAVNITSDKAVDEGHPAGSSLNNLCHFGFYTYAPFIRNGNTGNEIHAVWKRMDQVTQEDMTMVAYCCMRIWLDFIPKPGTTLTVTLTTESGRIITAQCLREPTS